MVGITLSTKTLGKKARREILRHIPTAKKTTRVDNLFVILDADNKMLAHVEEGNFRNPNAKLHIAPHLRTS
jgi:hypothetical protein